MTGAPQTDEEWRQAEAQMIWRQHGADAPTFIAERIGALALVNDTGGIQRFQQIAAALNLLMNAMRQ